jgi:hypothetical protein
MVSLWQLSSTLDLYAIRLVLSIKLKPIMSLSGSWNFSSSLVMKKRKRIEDNEEPYGILI